VFDPKTTIPPITTAIAPIKVVGSNQTAPSVIANSHIPPMAMVIFESNMSFEHLSMSSVSSSIWASIRDI
jgi:hypothetical protein